MKRIWIPLSLLALLALLLRPPVPLDETRYLAVAWEMHLADAWLVPPCYLVTTARHFLQ